MHSQSCRFLLILAVQATFWTIPLCAQSATFNVRAYGATGNGHTNDAQAIQAAEEAAERAGGGRVYLPAGRYLVSDAILIGSNIDFYGDGNQTVLIRTDHPSNVHLYQPGEDCAAARPPNTRQRFVLTNRHYNCVDRNIHLHDFEVDGSQVTSVPNSGMLCFSGLQDSTVERITVLNSPQDSMFFRNGGDHLIVEDNTILMHNRLWGNGEGINIEMHKEGHLWGGVTIRNNTIVTAASNFCTAALDRACSSDADCSGLQPPTCGHGASTVSAIGVTWVDGPHAPSLVITGNHIWVGNHHYGIICNGCSDTTISGNVILPATMRGIAVSGAFTGISSYATPAGQPQNMTIENNIIEGTERPDDGAAIQVTDAAARSDRVIVQGNVIAHKNSATALVVVRGWDHVDLSGNTLCGAPRNAVRLGAPTLPVGHVHQSGNVIAPAGKALPQACSNLPGPSPAGRGLQ